jgi:nucleoside-diphosphate-sugar epimerase
MSFEIVGKNVLVTGVAGFVGSSVARALLEQGANVVGVDNFLSESYPRAQKESNLLKLEKFDNFHFFEIDLRSADLQIIPPVDFIVNEAAMPGLMLSWSDLGLYLDSNVLVVGRLLDFARNRGVKRFVQISTSSVYGEFAVGSEETPAVPVSPYGVTKLAAEHLIKSFANSYEIPFVILRYFSVYGPGQRPDMAYNKFISAALQRRPITIFGDGSQKRTNTYIDDCVSGTIRSLTNGKNGETYNISGSASISVSSAVEIISKLAGYDIEVIYEDQRPGDQTETKGDSRKALKDFGFVAKVSPEEGLRAQFEWQKSLIV